MRLVHLTLTPAQKANEDNLVSGTYERLKSTATRWDDTKRQTFDTFARNVCRTCIKRGIGSITLLKMVATACHLCCNPSLGLDFSLSIQDFFVTAAELWERCGLAWSSQADPAALAEAIFSTKENPLDVASLLANLSGQSRDVCVKQLGRWNGFAACWRYLKGQSACSCIFVSKFDVS